MAASVAASVSAGPAFADEPETRARQAYLVEYPTKRVLFEKRAQQSMAPSSMTKLMTAFLIFEGLRAGALETGQPVKISRRAARQRGSSIDLKEGATVPLGTLLSAMITHSANDAAVALAEHVAGSEGKFAQRMTKRARQLGLRRSRFRNATGFSAKGHAMSAAEVAILSGIIIAKFPRLYELFSKRTLSHGGRDYANRNPLLGTVEGVDGLKTGQTKAGGYGLAVSAQRGGRRLILVINGLKSEEARAEEARKLLEWGFAQPPG